MELSLVLWGILAGLVATVAALPFEAYAYHRWGIRGVFEWHEVHASLFGFQSRRAHRLGTLVGHGSAGALAGGAFALGTSWLRLPVPLPVQGLGLGFLMWVVTLVVHEGITAVPPLRNGMGGGPAGASLAGHLAYGAALGLLLIGF